MRYRVVERPGFGWVVQLWDETRWRDVTRVYGSEEEAVRVKSVMEE